MENFPNFPTLPTETDHKSRCFKGVMEGQIYYEHPCDVDDTLLSCTIFDGIFFNITRVCFVDSYVGARARVANETGV